MQKEETSKDELDLEKETKRIEKSDEITSITKNRPIYLNLSRILYLMNNSK